MTEYAAQDIGSELRLAREQSGYTLRQIADATKLSVRALEALEGGRVNQLPTGIYRRAIVRAYAREIGLDPEEILRAFLLQHPDDLPAPPERATPKDSWGEPLRTAPPPPKPRRLQTALSVIGALVPVVAGVFYFMLIARGADASRNVTDLVPPRPEPPRTSAEIMPASATPTRPRRPAVLPPPVSMTISVQSTMLMQIVADGEEVVRRQVAPGEEIQLDVDDDVVLLGEDAGAVQFKINGRTGRQLGSPGTPLNVRIDRDDYQNWLQER